MWNSWTATFLLRLAIPRASPLAIMARGASAGWAVVASTQFDGYKAKAHH
jgi:hypothetical protein